MLLMIDNYDSFTYNLVQYLSEIGQEVKVYRNDKITIEEVNKLNPKYIVISPGPWLPLRLLETRRLGEIPRTRRHWL